jgi:MFS family permease
MHRGTRSVDRHPHGIGGFVLAIAVIAAVMAASTASSPFYPQIQESLGLNVVDVTLVFAVYPAGLLVTLLVAGSLSNHLGRRPVASLGLVLLAVSLAMFGWGGSLAMLLNARVSQGVATALVMSTISTYMSELAPRRLARHVALANSAGPTAGLAVGALLGGIMLDVAGHALALTFGLLIALILVLTVLLWRLPETSPRHPGAARSFLPRLQVPRPVRSTLLGAAPAIVASWGTGGLFISLGAHVAGEVFGMHNHTLQGATVGVLAGFATLAVVVLWKLRSPRLLAVGALALIVGTLVSIVAILTTMTGVYFAATALTGVGFGTVYAGALRLVLPLVTGAERAGVFSVIYVIAYLSFSVPAVIAGVFVSVIGFVSTLVGYGILVSLCALVALIALIVQGATRALETPCTDSARNNDERDSASNAPSVA